MKFSAAFGVLCGSRALFMRPASTDFSKFFFKTESHDIVYIFKNYFAIVFSVINGIEIDPICVSFPYVLYWFLNFV